MSRSKARRIVLEVEPRDDGPALTARELRVAFGSGEWTLAVKWSGTDFPTERTVRTKVIGAIDASGKST